MINEKNATYLYVGNVTNGFSDANTAVDLDALPAGSVTVVRVGSAATGDVHDYQAISASYESQVINKLSDGTIVKSPIFKTTDIVSAAKSTYTQPTEQVSFLGYDGSTVTGLGTITLNDSYTVGLWLNHTTNVISQSPLVKHICAYATGTTQAALAKSLMESHVANFSALREKTPTIRCERVALTTSIAAITTITETNMFHVVNGSKTVTAKLASISSGVVTLADGNIDENFTTSLVLSMPSSNGRSFSFNANATANGGHVIFIGTTKYTVTSDTNADGNGLAIAAAINAGTQATATTGAGAEATDKVTITYNEGQYYLPPYVIASVNNTTAIYPTVSILTGDAVPVKYKSASAFTADATITFELDIPWQGVTGYIMNSDTTEATMIGIALLTSDTWGLKFSAIPQSFNPVSGEYKMINFDIKSDSFATGYGTEYKSIKPTLGAGSWKQVAQLENYAQGNDNHYQVRAYPAIPRRAEAASIVGTAGPLGYDVITVNMKKTYTTEASGVTMTSPFTMMIAMRSGLDLDYVDTNFGVA